MRFICLEETYARLLVTDGWDGQFKDLPKIEKIEKTKIKLTTQQIL